VIALDATPAITGRTGIARYVTELAAAMEAAGTEVQRFALGRRIVPVPAGVRHVPIPLRVLDRWWRSVPWPGVGRGASSVHASGPLLVPSRRPVVGVVYDIAPLDHPELHPARDVEQLRRYVAGLHGAAAVVTISAATADRLVVAGVPEAKVHVVPIGRTPFPAPVAPPLSPRSYVLAVGAPVPRKGYGALVEAMARLPEHALVIVGHEGPDDDRLAAAAAGHGVRLVRVRDADDAALAGWYAAAAAVAVPSVEEGFGLPVVEAQAAAVPVVASDIAVFREVGGGHPFLVPVGDAGALADALEEAVSGHGTDLDAARANADRYSWAACATATLAVHAAVTQA
jgi:glycosyltransferase involved in cell wall biosynthesis